MPSSERTVVKYLIGYELLRAEAPEIDPVLVLSTEDGDHCFLVSRTDLRKLSAALQKCADELSHEN